MFEKSGSNKSGKGGLVIAFFFLSFRGIVKSNNKNKR